MVSTIIGQKILGLLLSLLGCHYLTVSALRTMSVNSEFYERLNSELQEKLRFKEQEKQDYVKFNYELQKELSAKKSETEELKRKNHELERRITMLHNADNVSEFAQDNNSTVKQEYIKKEIKLESEN